MARKMDHLRHPGRTRVSIVVAPSPEQHPFERLYTRLCDILGADGSSLSSTPSNDVVGNYSCDDSTFTPSQADAQWALARIPLEEQALVEHAVPARQWEFARTRELAHSALTQLGEPSAVVLRDSKRAPLWPEGITGSLTHTRGLQAVLAAHQGNILSIGLDAEIAQPLSPDVLRTVTTPQERLLLQQQTAQLPLGIVLFSAKESLYKAWYPLTQEWLGFTDAHLELTTQNVSSHHHSTTPTAATIKETREIRGSGTFVARVQTPVIERHRQKSPMSQYFAECTGLWEVGDGVIITALVVTTPRL